MLLLGLQHMFAMFGATILVPILVNTYFEGAGTFYPGNPDVCAGLGTLFFHACSKFKVPGFPWFFLCFSGWICDGCESGYRYFCRYDHGREACPMPAAVLWLQVLCT